MVETNIELQNDLERLQKLLRETGFLHGAETLVSMWRDNPEGLRQFLSKNDFAVLATDEGLKFLLDLYPSC